MHESPGGAATGVRTLRVSRRAASLLALAAPLGLAACGLLSNSDDAGPVVILSATDSITTGAGLASISPTSPTSPTPSAAATASAPTEVVVTTTVTRNGVVVQVTTRTRTAVVVSVRTQAPVTRSATITATRTATAVQTATVTAVRTATVTSNQVVTQTLPPVTRIVTKTVTSP